MLFKDRVRQLLAAVVVIVSAGTASWEERAMADAEVTLFYLPFHYETYVPVTIDSIEKEALCVMRVPSSAKEVAVLRRLLEGSSKGSFEDKVVRLKVVGLSTSPIFVDRDGGILKQPREEAKLSTDAFREFKALTGALATSHGCDI